MSTILVSSGIETKSYLKEILVRPLLPLNKMSLYLIREISHMVENLLSLRYTFRENLDLKAQLKEFISQRESLREILNENERLRGLLGYRERLPYRTICAEIIGYDPSNWSYSLIIDRGRRDGIQRDQLVIAYQGMRDGVVGRVTSVNDTWSEILSILNQNSALGVKVLRTQVKGVVEGKDSRFCRLKYLPYDADIKIGDVLVTSGECSIYPEGLPVGYVTNIKKEKEELFMEIEVRPFVEFAKLEDVLVIIKGKS